MSTTFRDSVAGCDLGELEWALSIDGRDANLGPNAYTHYDQETKTYTNFDQVFLTMQHVLTNTNANSLAELSLPIIEQIHDDCCAGYPFRSLWWTPMDSHLSVCMSHCNDFEAKRSLVVDLPDDLLNITYQQDGEVDGHIAVIFPKCTIDTRDMFRRLIANYNDDLKLANGSHDLEMEALARFLRSSAWLHPFVDHNGRLRNLLLQREIRRLGLGRCAMMYNNNRDIYFTNTSAYADKIREGIAAADETRSTGRIAWLNATWVERHLERFNTSSFAYCKQAFVGKSSEPQWGSIE
jgi:hypothetical protein